MKIFGGIVESCGDGECFGKWGEGRGEACAQRPDRIFGEIMQGAWKMASSHPPPRIPMNVPAAWKNNTPAYKKLRQQPWELTLSPRHAGDPDVNAGEVLVMKRWRGLEKEMGMRFLMSWLIIACKSGSKTDDNLSTLQLTLVVAMLNWVPTMTHNVSLPT